MLNEATYVITAFNKIDGVTFIWADLEQALTKEVILALYEKLCNRQDLDNVQIKIVRFIEIEKESIKGG